MDSRRLDTGQVLASGILNLSVPETDVPHDREEVSATDDDTWRFIGAERVMAALADGKLVGASNYYGIPYLWEQDGAYRGVLLQYRNVTEDLTFDDVEDAVVWFEGRYYETDG